MRDKSGNILQEVLGSNPLDPNANKKPAPVQRRVEVTDLFGEVGAQSSSASGTGAAETKKDS